MHTYNKIMTNFWLVMTLLIVAVVTYFGITEGFKRWNFYYLFAGLTLLMYIVRRWMLRRMEKHLDFLREQKENDSQGK